MVITPITLADLTSATISGNGVFDVLMRANKVHLEEEFSKGRIKGPEYATVYLGSLDTVMNAALQFLLQKDKISLESQLLEQQVLVAQQAVLKSQQEVLQIQAQVALATQQKANLVAELAILQANALKVPAEVAHLQAQTLLVGQQKANAVIEGTVLSATQCKLTAEYDVLMLTKDKTAQETNLLLQKVVTERAQVTSLGVDDDSVVGKQKALYSAQTAGFTRDAEQKAAKVMVDSWNVRRTTDETGVDGNLDNMLNDGAVGRAVNKLLAGVGA